MGNDDNTFSVISHSAENIKKLFGFLRSENSCRFIKNKNISSTIKHLDNFNRLLFRNRHFINFLLGVKIEAVLIDDIFNFFNAFFKVVLFVFNTENNIFSRTENIN